MEFWFYQHHNVQYLLVKTLSLVISVSVILAIQYLPCYTQKDDEGRQPQDLIMQERRRRP